MRDHKSFAHHFTIRPNLSVAIGTECYTDDAICESGRRSPFEEDNRGTWSVTNRVGFCLEGPVPPACEVVRHGRSAKLRFFRSTTTAISKFDATKHTSTFWYHHEEPHALRPP